jgi:Uncharacterized conserved protein (COG2071)
MVCRLTTVMKIPTLKGIIKHRLLVNFRADPEIIQRVIPRPFRPKLHRGCSIVGVCLIRLEHIRPVGLPGLIGISSENAAHRIAVEWTDGGGQEREGVYVPRRDTGSFINHIAGWRVFPGEHHSARFDVRDIGEAALGISEFSSGAVSDRIRRKMVLRPQP